MKKITKIISFILIAIILFSSSSVVVFANEKGRQRDATTKILSTKDTKLMVIESCVLTEEAKESPIFSTTSINLLSQRVSKKDKCSHKQETIVIEPTCKRYGYTVVFCDVCNYSFIKNFKKAIPHTFEEFNITFNKKEELHRICVVCEYEEFAKQQRSDRFFSKKKIVEKIWSPYQATKEQREKIKERLNELGIVTENNKLLSDVPGYVWNYLMKKIDNEYGVAGLMANLYAESGIRSTNLQGTYEDSLGYTDETYTKAVDNRTYKNFVYDAAGYGLAQWTSSGRKQNLLNYAQKTNRSIGDIDMQLEFLWQELTVHYPDVVSKLKNATKIKDASSLVMLDFERPLDQSEEAQNTRAEYGQMLYEKYTQNK